MADMADTIRINHAPKPNPRPIDLIPLVKRMKSKSGKRSVLASRSGGWAWLWNASVSAPLFLNSIVLCLAPGEELDEGQIRFLNQFLPSCPW
jgi:hypothetical protein